MACHPIKAQFLVMFTPKRIAFRAIRHSKNTFVACSRLQDNAYFRSDTGLPICDSPLRRSARRSFAPLQISQRNRRSYVRTRALSGIVFVGIV